MMRLLQFLIGCSRLTLLLILLLGASVTLYAQTGVQQSECTVRAGGDFARVRSEWSTEGDEVARIGRNDDARYVVRGRNASDGFSWYFIGIGWVRADVVELSGDCDNLPVLFTRVGSAFSSDAYPCPANFAGYLPPRIQTGQNGVIVRDGGVAFFVYALPERNSAVTGFIPDGVTLERVGIGPLCQDGLVFWEISVSGVTGFVIESDARQQIYYLDGGTSAPVITLPDGASSDEPTIAPTLALNNPTQVIPLGEVPAELLTLNADASQLAIGAIMGESLVLIDVESSVALTLITDVPVIAFTFNADGGLLLVADADGGLGTWNTLTGQQTNYQRLIDAPQEDVIAAFSLEASRVAVRDCAELDTTDPDAPICRRSVITVFDTQNNETTARVNVPGEVSALALSPFGNALAVIAENGAILWPDVINDAGGGRTVPTFMTPLTLTFNPGGTRLIVGGCAEFSTVGDEISCNFSNVGAWTVDGNVAEVMRNRNITGGVVSVAFAPDDGQVFAVATADSVRTHRLEDGEIIRQYDNPEAAQYLRVRLAPSDGLIAASTEDAIYLWSR